MPINWQEFDKSLESAINESADSVDTKLASQISSITTLTDAEVNELFPEPADLEKLAALLKVVKSSETQSNKINSIVKNAEEFASTILTLLSRVT